MKQIYKCDLCKRLLPEIELHNYPFTACDDCFDEAGNADRFVSFVKDRKKVEKEKTLLTAWDFYFGYGYVYKGHNE